MADLSGLSSVGVVLLELIPLLMGAFGRYTNIYNNLRLDFALLRAKYRTKIHVTDIILSHHKEQILRHHKEHGFLAAYFLRNIFPEASVLMDKIERHVLRGDAQHAITFMEAQALSFNMTAVAGAIMAQVAMTSLSLARLAHSHWTTEALLIVSLVCGALSVFFSCAMHPSTRGLYDADRVRNWLSKPTTAIHKDALYSSLRAAELEVMLSRELHTSPTPERSKTQNNIRIAAGSILSGLCCLPSFGLLPSLRRPHHNTVQERMAHNDESLNLLRIVDSELSAHRWEVASCYAAIMLVVPMRLLTLSLTYFIIGLGIYLGRLYTRNLIPEFGSGSLGILLLFIAALILALASFYIPRAMKNNETWASERYEELVHIAQSEESRQREDQEASIRAATPPDTVTTPQSVHLRKGRVVSYTLQDTEAKDARTRTQHPSSTEPVIEIEKQASMDSTSNPTPPKLSPLAPQSSIFEANDAPRNSNIDFQSTMESLICAQEESVKASRRLLELYLNQTR